MIELFGGVFKNLRTVNCKRALFNRRGEVSWSSLKFYQEVGPEVP
jgi:hypothetical protein